VKEGLFVQVPLLTVSGEPCWGVVGVIAGLTVLAGVEDATATVWIAVLSPAPDVFEAMTATCRVRPSCAFVGV
jgi:hypothetical protein